MSPQKLARNLLSFRASTSLMLPGALAAQIGQEALQDALQRGWVQPDYESGFLTVAPHATTLHEIEQIAESVCKMCNKVPCTCEESRKEESHSTHDIVVRHSRRMIETYGIGPGHSTSGSPGTGQDERPATTQSPSPTVAPNRPGQDYMVGEDVVIASEGKSYQAKISSKNPNGTYRLSFGPNMPLRQDREFRREELQRVDPHGTNLVPVSRP